ncbi:hypothetical protein P8452_67894 [Trifolium repens]|nr:hypothetical protein P8452_67894 [Trifolium repens]
MPSSSFLQNALPSSSSLLSSSPTKSRHRRMPPTTTHHHHTIDFDLACLKSSMILNLWMSINSGMSVVLKLVFFDLDCCKLLIREHLC